MACKANDNAFLVNDNGIYMTKGKVVNGESVGVGRTSSSVNRGSFSGFTASESFGSSRAKKTGATSAASGTTLKVVEKAAKPEIKEGAAKLSGVLSKSKSDRIFGEHLSAEYSSKKVATASTSGTSVTKNVDNIISEAERKGFRGVRGSNNLSGLELKNALQLEGRTYQYNRNLAQNVDGRVYTGHALDQMQNRGIPLSVVRNAIEKGKKVEAKRNCWEYIDYTNRVSVITAKDTGNVITVKWRK